MPEWPLPVSAPAPKPAPAPELKAAMAETRRVLDLLDEITQDITRKSGTTSAYLLRKAASVRARAGLA